MNEVNFQPGNETNASGELEKEQTKSDEPLNTEGHEPNKMELDWKKISAVIAIVALAGAGVFYYFNFSKGPFKPHYVEAYTLVNDSISQGANIQINLPDGVAKETAKSSVAFSPEIKGDWAEVDSSIAGADKVLVFNPKDDLELNKYYEVTLTTEKGEITKDFLVAENPEVISVFPRNDSEASEASDVTIIFNRPMVPLSTLEEMGKYEIPVEILPKTEGKFKWIGTRTLQFIPTDGLIASANYTIKIKDGFISMDGLKIKNFEHKFTTRHLRYEYLSSDELIYNQPIRLQFNQPVDLIKTIREISVVNKESSKEVEIKTEYGAKKVLNEKSGKYKDELDQSVILVYNAKDRFGREKFWDFSNNYELKIKKAYPIDGDINLDETRATAINVTNVVSYFTATSERSNQVRVDFFDPQGELQVGFYEDIDLSKSIIKADKLADIKYGEKCKDDGNMSYSDEVDCEKVLDQKKLIIKFNSSIVNKGETLKVDFEKIRNFDGFLLNAEDITQTINVIPDLKITKTNPENGAANADLTQLVICSNSPINWVDNKDIDEHLTLSSDYELDRWQMSYLIADENDAKCKRNEFITYVYYGLAPLTDYNLVLKVEDNFGSQAGEAISFKTAAMDSDFLNFYHFQKRYNVTTPDKTSLTYAVNNMEYVDVNICKISAEDMLMVLGNKPSDTIAPNKVKVNCFEEKNLDIQLEKKYWMKNYFKFVLADQVDSPVGHYIISFSNPNYKNDKGQQYYERTYLTVTNLSVVEKNVELSDEEWAGTLSEADMKRVENLYWVNDLKSLAAISGAQVEIYSKTSAGKLEKKEIAVTDNTGIAKSKPVKNIAGIIVREGYDTAVITDDTEDLGSGANAYTASQMYVYTDKPLYLPGQTVHIKGLYRVGYDGNYEIFKDKKVKLVVLNSEYEEIANKELAVNDFGTFETEVVIDAQASLGNYQININEYQGYASFDILEYVPAPFKVEVKAGQDEYMSGDTFGLDVQADYYFGAPVEGGEVEYSVSSQNYYFDKYQGEYFNFGADWYNCYYDCDFGDKYLFSNKVSFGAEGKAKISHKIDLNELFKEDDRTSKLITVSLAVKNTSGQSISATKTLIYHAGEFYLGVKTDKYFAGKNEDFNVKAKSVNIKGEETEIKDIDLSLNRVDYVRNKRQEVDGGYYYRWEKQLTEIESRKVSTDKRGDWNGNFKIDKEGEYEIIVKVGDDKGNQIKSVASIYIWGEAQVSIQPNNDNALEIEIEKANLNVGDKAKMIIKSPYPKAKALITIERGNVYKYDIVDINQSLYNYEFDIIENYIPNIYASVVLLSPDPEVRYGSAGFSVDTKEKELNIEVKSNKIHYLPGEEVELNFKVTDNANRGVETELSTAVVDLSVLALKGNPKKNPVVFFYGGFPLTISTASNVRNILFEVDVPAGTKGGGGSEPSDLASKKRGEFKETAFWQAVIKTDTNGEAKIKFTLPDNLTTWQIESLGITKDTKLGVDYVEIMARKDLMVVPLEPRFIIPGDEFMIGAKVFNQSDSTQKIDISLISDTLSLDDKKEKDLKLKAGETGTVYFKVSAPSSVRSGYHKYTISAKNDKYNDTVEKSIKITPNNTYETTASAGSSDKGEAREYVFLPNEVVKDKGELTINNSATLAVFMSDAMDYMFGYPYGCSEQAASKLEAIAIATKGLNLENIGDDYKVKTIEFDGQEYTVKQVVSLGLARIYENQNWDGSFTYYSGGESNLYLTLHVTKVLGDLRSAGFEVDSQRINSAVSYINSALNVQDKKMLSKDTVILAGYTLSELGADVEISDYILNQIKGYQRDDKFVNEDINSATLAYLAIFLSVRTDFDKAYKELVYKNLENRLTIDSRGAFIPMSENHMWEFYESNIKNTALFLSAMSMEKKDNSSLDQILRWLLSSRKKDGAWGSTNATMEVIDAMTKYIQWKQENKSNFTLKFFVNDKEKNSFTYGPENILQQNTTVIPLSELNFGGINKLFYQKENLNSLPNNFYYDMSLKYYLPVDVIPPKDEGFAIARSFYHLDDKKYENPVVEAKVGDVLKGHIEIVVPKSRNYVSLEDYIPAGVELIDFDLATENQAATTGENYSEDDSYGSYQQYEEGGYYSPDYGISKFRQIYPLRKELRNDRLFIFIEWLDADTYEYNYYVRVLIPGKFHHLPAVVSEMYTPENFGRTKGEWFSVEEEQ